MPTITIRTEPGPASRHRAIALRLTRWLADRGTPAAHVVVRFEEWPAGTYSGGLPVEALPYVPGQLRYGAVTCQVGPDRDDEFRAGLASEIAAALGVGPGTPFFYLEFRSTAPADVFIARHGSLVRADGAIKIPVRHEAVPVQPTGGLIT